MENIPDIIKNNTPQSPILTPSDKLYTLGLMTNRIIHEMNNSIQGILLLINFLKMNYADDETIGSLDQEIQKIKNLTRSVLDYSKMNNISYDPLDLSTVINNTLSLLEDLTGDPVLKSIETKYPPSSPWIKGNVFHLQQAFLNIFLFWSWAVKHYQTSAITVEILHDSPLNIYTVKIRQSEQAMRRTPLPLIEYAERAKLDLAQKIFHKHRGNLHFSEDNTKHIIFIVTLPAFHSSSNQAD